MISKTEAERLAHAVNAMRPDWPLSSLLTFISRNLAGRALRDVAVALAWVACDPETKTPARVLEAGPWWKATQAEAGTVSAITHRCPEHPTRAAWNCPECEAEAVSPDSVPELAAAVRAAMKPRPKPAPRRDPEPTDLSATRARADKEKS